MRVIAGVGPTDIYGGSFTGDVRLAMLRAAPEPSAPDVALVSFRDGAVTKWHAHPGGQLFWVVSGTAVVGSESTGEQILQPGTLVDTAADESHWHGAAVGADAQLLCFTRGTTAWTDRDPRA